MSFLNPSRKTSETVSVRGIQFLGEQNGPPEQLLKDRLTDLFRRDNSISRAYLARVDFGDGKNASVVLGLQTHFGPDNGMVEKVGVIFASVFNAKEHLDLMFLSASQEAQLIIVCEPFFKRSENES